MIAHKTQSTDMAMAGILKKLRDRSAQFSAEQAVSEKKAEYDCLDCKDKGIIVYRVHQDTERQLRKEQKTMESLNADQMVREEDYLAGKVCLPDQAREWKTTYSKQCECVKRKKIARLMEASGITEEFEMLLFGNFITDGKPDMIKEAYECAMEYFKDFQKVKGERSNSIALLGQPGSGKTHLLTAIMNNLIKKKSVYCMYFPYVEGMGNLRDNFDQLESKLDAMRKADVLFIDDLFKPVKGEPRATDWQVEQIQSVVNYRYLNHKPLLISSELDTAALLDIDEALGSRIHQMCRNYTVIIKGDRMQLNHRLGEWE
ncbi:ATP-binding protein [Bacillus amyloliquefaciens]|uniref:ATP-binding protein n=1 Tax=Bacillus TaxID=1386 RepID=UPI001115A9F8|nr:MULTISPECIES: ATP-binding protein [Bacillus]MDH2300324.1 ATP-binding protein [Bacillus velezensis]MDL5022442.1 ATP-binding protein [Bacillus velezensis]MDR4960604.1 ATP-binding protein [Bacillus velezensis]MEC2162726.1 ATP-binding protein [Bacillus velezensis]MEC2196116.1 ATP-binding protein [Bacillus velezensis]